MERPTTRPCAGLGFFSRWIPGLLPGIFATLFGCVACADVSLLLAEELLAEQQWDAARVEGLRAQHASSGPDVVRARLIIAIASVRSGDESMMARAEMENIWKDETAPLETRCLAAYEAGLARWSDHDRPTAIDALSFSFLKTRGTSLFWRSGCSLYFLFKEDRKTRRREPALWQAIQSCRDAWPLEVWRECRPKRRRSPSPTSLPGRCVVALYRAQISPAIGARCDMVPSCSEYFLQASRAHGILGIPMIADRFVREPSMVSASRSPVVMPDGRIRYADPVSAHDRWMRRAPSPRR